MSAENKKRCVFLTFLLTIHVAGCEGWRSKTQTGLTVATSAIRAASAIAEPYYSHKCEAAATACVGASECPPLAECQESRRALNRKIVAAHSAVGLGYAALIMGDPDLSRSRLSVAVSTIAEIQDILKNTGALKWLNSQQ